MVSRFVARSLLCSAVLLSANPARAAVIDQIGAETIRTALEANIGKQASMLKMNQLDLVHEGAVKVEPKGSYYAVTLPRLMVTDNTGKLDLGVIAMNVMPGAKDKQWKVSTALGSPLRFLDKDGKDFLQIKIGSQRINAIIDENFTLPLMIDAQLQNMSVDDAPTGSSVSLGDFTIKSNYTEDAPGIWSGPTTFTLTNLNVVNKGPEAKSPGTFSIASMTANSEVKGMDMNMVKQYQQKMTELAEAGFKPDGNMSAESMRAMWKIIMDYGLKQADSAKMNIDIKNLAVDAMQEPKDGKPAEPMKFTIGQLGYGAEATNMKGDKANGSLSLTMANFTPPAVPADAIKYIPRSVVFNFGFKDLPIKDIFAQIGALGSQSINMQQPGKQEDAKMMAMQTMMTMPAILSKAGTVFSLSNTKVANDLYDLSVNGEFAIKQDAVYGGTGTMKAVFAGMDQVVSELQALAQKPDVDPTFAQQVMQTTQGLTMLQMFGQQGVDANGKPARIYDLSLDATGAAKLNGTDMSAMMGGGAPGAGGTAPALDQTPAQAPAK